MWGSCSVSLIKVIKPFDTPFLASDIGHADYAGSSCSAVVPGIGVVVTGKCIGSLVMGDRGVDRGFDGVG